MPYINVGKEKSGDIELEYWPALYFIDAQGRIRHHHFGEGEYE